MTRILVADDEAGVCSVIQLLLRREGYQVVTCPDGQAALDLLAAQDFAAVLTDLNLPRVHGARVIAAARAARPDLPIVVMSGDGVCGDGEASLPRIEGLYHLPKPFKPRDLVALVGAITGRFRRAGARLADGAVA